MDLPLSTQRPQNKPETGDLDLLFLLLVLVLSAFQSVSILLQYIQYS